MFDLTKKIEVPIDEEFTLILNPADGHSADPHAFMKYTVDFWNSDNGHNEIITFFISNKLYAILHDLNYWTVFLKKLAHPGFEPLHYFGEDFERGEDYMFLTFKFNYEIA